MEVLHSKNEQKGVFYVLVNDEKLAEMTYAHAGPDKIIIDHTEVNEKLKGQGIGYKLVEGSVNYARDRNLKILPLCPFANAVFKKKPEYSDVLF